MKLRPLCPSCPGAALQAQPRRPPRRAARGGERARGRVRRDPRLGAAQEAARDRAQGVKAFRIRALPYPLAAPLGDDARGPARARAVALQKLGNKLNDGGATAVGFSLESLLKLDTSKAFDKQTSILQYVIVVMKRLEAKDAPAARARAAARRPRPRARAGEGGGGAGRCSTSPTTCRPRPRPRARLARGARRRGEGPARRGRDVPRPRRLAPAGRGQRRARPSRSDGWISRRGIRAFTELAEGKVRAPSSREAGARARSLSRRARACGLSGARMKQRGGSPPSFSSRGWRFRLSDTHTQVRDVEEELGRVRSKFADVLAYFGEVNGAPCSSSLSGMKLRRARAPARPSRGGEDDALSPEGLFSTLQRVRRLFGDARKVVERARRSARARRRRARGREARGRGRVARAPPPRGRTPRGGRGGRAQARGRRRRRRRARARRRAAARGSAARARASARARGRREAIERVRPEARARGAQAGQALSGASRRAPRRLSPPHITDPRRLHRFLRLP